MKRWGEVAALTMAVTMLVGAVPTDGISEKAYAAGPTIGKINGTEYDSLPALNDALSALEGKRAIIEMTTDWNAANSGGGQYNRHLVIPSDCNATFVMHGHVFNRNNAWQDNRESDGELIRVNSGATLTINGGFNDAEQSIEHANVAVYASTEAETKAAGRGTFYGGLLTGGCSSDTTGGVYVKKNATLILKNVTIAGCGAEGVSARGGGVRLYDDGSRLIMENSTIDGCHSRWSGGGVYIGDDDGIVIEMNNSGIVNNWANDHGGGIYVDGEKVHISGTNGSRIKNNHCDENGGGIALYDKEESVTGLEISGNKSANGGGIYTDTTKASLSSLTIKDNVAAQRGGGIYLSKGESSMSACEITNNTAKMSGGGVYVNTGVKEKFTVSGKTIIKGNDGVMKGDNLYISDNDPENTRVMFSVNKGSDVWMSYYNLGNRNSVMVTMGERNDTNKSPNCIQYLHADNQGWHFGYNAKPDYRKIYYVKDGKDSTVPCDPPQYPDDPVDIMPRDAINNPGDTSAEKKAGKVGEVGPGGYEGSGYDLIRGFTRHEETDSDTNDSAVAFYYSDAFFTQLPHFYNEHLATASLNMAYAGMYLRAKEPYDANQNYYYNRHAAARQFMADIGCPDQNIYVNDSNEHKPQTDSIGVTIASKTLRGASIEGKTLIPIVVRGGGYELEWASNGTLDKSSQTTGRDMEAKGFSSAADQVKKEIEKYLDKYDLRDEIASGNVVFWITGYSRAGATANLTAKRLVEDYACGESGKENLVYAYTCEAPMGGTDAGEHLASKSTYYCIHNLINAVDIVPLVAPSLMGFKRYGVDHYIPGGDAASNPTSASESITRSGTGGVGSRTTYKDNDRILVKQMDAALKEKMLKQLKMVDSGILLDDYFHPMAMNLFPSPSIYENGNYDNNHVEEFIKDFLRFAQEGIAGEDWSSALPSRDAFVDNVQPAIRDLLAMVFSMDPDSSTGFINRASTMTDKLDDMTMLTIYTGIFKGAGLGWHNLSEFLKNDYTATLWWAFESTEAMEYLSDEDAAKLKKHWKKLLNFALSLAEADFNYEASDDQRSRSWAGGSDKKFMLLGTFATYSNFILQNHYPEVNLAWARAYDSYYNNETTEYEILYQDEAKNSGYSVNIPAATGEDAGAPKDLVEGAGQINTLKGDQKIVLEVGDIVGEAVYYNLVDKTDGTEKQLESNKLYRGGVDLAIGDGIRKNYTIKTYAISYGVRSAEAVYNINLTDGKHRVEVVDGSGDTKVYSFMEGEKATISASTDVTKIGDKNFTHWEISVFDSAGNLVVQDVAEHLIPSTLNKVSASFDMPDIGDETGEAGYTYPEGYTIKAIAHFEYKISQVKPVNPAGVTLAPVEGQDFVGKAEVFFKKADDEDWWTVADGQGNFKTYDIIWSYNDGTKDIIVSGQAAENTAYKATIVVPQDADINIWFSATNTLQGYIDEEAAITVRRNDGNGSAILEILFDETGGDTPVHPAYTLRVDPKDINTLEPYESAGESVYYEVSGGDALSVTAPEIDNMKFEIWDLDAAVSSGDVTLDSGGLDDKTIGIGIADSVQANPIVINADYKPLLNVIDIRLDEPVADSVVQSQAQGYGDANPTMTVTISNGYIVDPNYVSITWTPEPIDEGGGTKKADYLVAYTATVSLVPDSSGNIQVKKAVDGTPKTISATFDYAEYPTVTVNGQPAVLNKAENSVSYTFPMTKYTLVSVENPSDISGAPHGADEDGIRVLLPETVKILLSNGSTIDASVTWALSKTAQTDGREEEEWTATATVTLPDTVDDKNGVLDPANPITVKVTTLEADTAQMPEASINSGDYYSDQYVTITTYEDGGTTYYTLDGSIPTTGSTVYSEGDVIEIKRADRDVNKQVVLSAYTVKNGKWDSAVVSYVYSFPDTCKVPGDKERIYTSEEQVGVGKAPSYLDDAGAYKPIYKITSVSSGARITEEGDMVATDVGTYTATLHIADGFEWKIDNDDGTSSYTTTDQQITFTITPLSLKTAQIRILTDPVKADGTPLEPQIEVTVNGLVVPPEYYDVVYSDNVNPGQGKVRVIGKGNYTDESEDFTFEITGDDSSDDEWNKEKEQKGDDSSDDEWNKEKEQKGDDSSDDKWNKEKEQKEKKRKAKEKKKDNSKGNDGIWEEITEESSEQSEGSYTITYRLMGGVLEGKTEDVKATYVGGTIINLPIPTREGFKFLYWKDSVDNPPATYNPEKCWAGGQQYLISYNHIFEALWQEDIGTTNTGHSEAGKQVTADRKSADKGSSDKVTTDSIWEKIDNEASETTELADSGNISDKSSSDGELWEKIEEERAVGISDEEAPKSGEIADADGSDFLRVFGIIMAAFMALSILAAIILLRRKSN